MCSSAHVCVCACASQRRRLFVRPRSSWQIDWDYHMRLSPRGTPFLDPALGSIIHFYHFR